MKTVRVMGATLVGTGAELVTVEARFERRDRDRTEIVITGLPDPVIRESRGRLECALQENQLRLGSGRLYLNLVPAGRKKSGEILDLPLVLAAAAAAAHIEPSALIGTLFLGEVGIDGTLHAVPGGLAAALAARDRGIERIVAPAATAQEAACVPGIEALGADHLVRVIAHFASDEPVLRPVSPPEDDGVRTSVATSLDEVRGHAEAKFALSVAAAGGHALLLIGPPGAGKSMLARRLVRLLPPPNLEERLEITRVLSAAGRWPGSLAVARPYRAPHHTTTHAGLVGGGVPLTPGEITLAHRGVLFLDELPEFRREALEALRQPIETGELLISRAGKQVELPARFQLVAAMNPCPCGYHGHARIPCACPPSAISRYRRRISGPLLDRIDLRIELQPPTLEELTPSPPPSKDNGRACPEPENEPHESDLIDAVRRALEAAARRGQARRNADIPLSFLERIAPIAGPSQALLARAIERLAFSARAIQSVRCVARTIADLEGSEQLDPIHFAQALALRASLDF